MMSMIFVVGAAIVITIFRYAKTSCETGTGLFTSWLIGGLLAWGWYDFMRKCGLGRLDDIFGISNRILPMQSYEDNTPVTCVPVAE